MAATSSITLSLFVQTAQEVCKETTGLVSNLKTTPKYKQLGISQEFKIVNLITLGIREFSQDSLKDLCQLYKARSSIVLTKLGFTELPTDAIKMQKCADMFFRNSPHAQKFFDRNISDLAKADAYKQLGEFFETTKLTQKELFEAPEIDKGFKARALFSASLMHEGDIAENILAAWSKAESSSPQLAEPLAASTTSTTSSATSTTTTDSRTPTKSNENPLVQTASSTSTTVVDPSIKKAQESCQTAQQAYTIAGDAIVKAKAKQEKIETEMQEKNLECDALKDAIASSETACVKAKESLESAIKELETTKSSIEKFTKQLEDLKTELTQARQKETEGLDSFLESVISEEDYGALGKEVERIQDQVKAVEKQNIEVLPKRHFVVKKRIEAEKSHKNLQLELVQLQERLAEATKELEELDSSLTIAKLESQKATDEVNFKKAELDKATELVVQLMKQQQKSEGAEDFFGATDTAV